MTDRKAVLAANAVFCRAFSNRDPAAMGDVWSQSAPVSCVHPGWEPLYGRKSVLASWQRILTNPATPDIAIRAPKATVMDNTAIVICYEIVSKTVLVATNFFIREGTAWKVVHHQATLTALASPRKKPAAPPTVH